MRARLEVPNTVVSIGAADRSLLIRNLWMLRAGLVMPEGRCHLIGTFDRTMRTAWRAATKALA
jgi:hypothetical protein